ncbi:hypothetical protein KCP70_02025 [Salmonella enterica subsp. enterica]|nr:hypothetical protein KCP70_02025 [Salmonella enterica subsp. enterica]
MLKNLRQSDGGFLRYVFGYSSPIVLSSRHRVSCMLKRVLYSLLVPGRLAAADGA